MMEIKPFARLLRKRYPETKNDPVTPTGFWMIAGWSYAGCLFGQSTLQLGLEPIDGTCYYLLEKNSKKSERISPEKPVSISVGIVIMHN